MRKKFILIYTYRIWNLEEYFFTTVDFRVSGNNEIIACAYICDVLVVRISFKHRSVPWREEMRSYMEVGIDVRQKWPPFAGPEIHVRVYAFILKYMNPPKFQTTGVTYTVSKLYNVLFFLNGLLAAILLKTWYISLYRGHMIGYPFRTSHVYEWDGSTFGCKSVPNLCPLSPFLPPRPHPSPRSVTNWAK